MADIVVEDVEDSKYKKYFLNRFNREELPALNTWRENFQLDYFERTKFKDEEISEKKRLEGNKLFEKGNLYEAIKLFSESAAYAEKNSVLMYKAFGNRSAASFDGGLYPECIKDIELAFQHGYPKKDSYKLLIRQAVAYNFLNKTSELQEVFEQLKDLDPDLTDDKIMDILKVKKRKEKIIEAYYPEELPSVAYGNSSEAPCASIALSIKYDGDKYGRHLVVTRDIKIGDILIVEESHCDFLMNYVRNTHCNYCLKHCVTLIPCDKCTWAMFCSEECLDKANKMFHTEECIPLSRFLLVFNSKTFDCGDKFQVPFTIRTLAKVGFKNLQPYFDRMNCKEKKPNKEEARRKGFVNGVYDTNNFETIFNLQDDFEQADPRALPAASSEAQVVIKCLGFDLKDEYTQNFAALYIKLKLNNLINTYIPIAESVYYLDNDDFQYYVQKSERVMSGSPYYPYHHLIAHSCSPNVASYWIGKSIVTYATQPIAKGQKIVVNYAVGDRTDRSLNLKSIKDFHHFVCNCERCLKFKNKHPNEHFDYFHYPPDMKDFFTELLKMTRLQEILKYRNKERETFINKINQEISIRNDFMMKYYPKHKFDYTWQNIRSTVIILNSLKGSLIVIKDSDVKYPHEDSFGIFNEPQFV